MAVQRVVHVHAAAVAVGADGDAPAQMADDEVEVFVALSPVGGVAAGHGALVQGVPGGDARHQRRAGQAGHVVQFVRHARVGDERAASLDAPGYVGGDEAAQVAGMGTGGRLRVVQHPVVDFVDSAGDGFEQASAPDDGVEPQGDALRPQFAEHHVFAEVELVGHVGKGR